MKLSDRIRGFFAHQLVKVANISFVPDWAVVHWISPLFKSLVEEGVRANSAVFACLETLVFAFGEPPLLAYGENSDAPMSKRSPIMKLLRQPNPDMNFELFAQTMVMYAAISGNAYAWIQPNQAGQPMALWPLNDTHIIPIPGKSSFEGIVSHYELVIEGQDNLVIPKEQMIHFKWLPDPLSPEKGIGALAAAARDTDMDNTVGYYAFRLLKNDAVPRLIVTLVEGDTLDENRAQRLKLQWKQSYGGENSGSPAFLEAGMKVERAGMGLQELAFDALRHLPETRIAAAFRVPPIVAGLDAGLQVSSYSNYEQAREAFTEDTLSPLWRAFAGSLQLRLVTAFGGGFVLRHYLSDVRSLQQDQDKLWLRVTAAFEKGLITRAEAKKEIGLEAKPEDEVYQISSSTIYLPAGSAISGTSLDALAEPEPVEPPALPQPGPSASTDEATEEEPKGGIKVLDFKDVNGSKGAMIALMLDPLQVQQLGFGFDGVSGLQLTDPDTYHITLAYLGPDASMLPRGGILRVAEDVARSWLPIRGTSSAVGQFEIDGDLQPVWADFESNELMNMRAQLVQALRTAGIEPQGKGVDEYNPHITLAYVPKGSDVSSFKVEETELTFKDLTVAFGGTRVLFPFLGEGDEE